MEWDEAQHFPKELMPKLAELGLMGIQFPDQYGGAGMSAVDYCICIEELARVDPSVSLSVAAHNGLGAAHIAMFANDAAETEIPGPARAGREAGGVGTHRTGLGQRRGGDAHDGGPGRRLLGVERIEDVHHARHLGGHARDHGGDRQVERREGYFRVYRRARTSSGQTAGLVAGKKEDKLGMRASETTEVILQNCRVPASQLIGEAGQGFIQTLQVLDAGRIGIAALSVGLAQGAYEAAARYTAERKQFGRAIASFPAIQERLAQHQSQVDAARLLTYRAAWLKDQGRRMTLESAMAKLYSSEIAVRAAEDGVQMHGGYGFVKDYPAEKFLRDVKLLTIGEGTSEVQRLVIARQLLAA